MANATALSTYPEMFSIHKDNLNPYTFRHVYEIAGCLFLVHMYLTFSFTFYKHINKYMYIIILLLSFLSSFCFVLCFHPSANIFHSVICGISHFKSPRSLYCTNGPIEIRIILYSILQLKSHEIHRGILVFR